MKKLFVVLLALCMAFSLVACSSESEDGSTFTYAINGEPNSIDPANVTQSVVAYIIQNTYWPMFLIGEDGTTVNGAVTDYEIDDSGTVYTFYLSEDNYWSDGEPVTAHHYVYGMLRSLGFTTADSYYSYFIRDFVLNASKYGGDEESYISEMTDVGIVALDDYTIQITLEQPCDYYVELMTMFVFYPLREDVAPELDTTWASEPHVTNGAYTYESIDYASEIVMVKNEYFTNADDVTTDKLVAVVMEDSDAQLMAYQTGEIDFATGVDTATAYSLYADTGELWITSAIIAFRVSLNCFGDTEALQDYNVRRAIQLGIDRSNIVTALNAGDIYYETYGLVPYGFEGIDGDFREEQDATNQLVYTDKDEARALMEAAGYSETNRLSLTYTTTSITWHNTIALVLAEELADIYIDLTIETIDSSALSSYSNSGQYDLMRSFMSADYLDVTTYLDMALTYNQSYHGWGDETYDEMIADANTLSGDERIQALHDAETYLIETMAYTVPLIGYRTVCVGSADIEGIYSTYQGNFIFMYVKVSE